MDAPRKGCQGLPEAAAGDIVSFAWAVACVEGLRTVAGILALKDALCFVNDAFAW